jgi:hypothetical protein
MKVLLPLPLHPIIDWLNALKANTITYYDRKGQPIYIPGEAVALALEADHIDAGAEQGDLGVLTMFGPYTSAQLRSVVHIAQASDGEDDAMLAIVAHTSWGYRDEEGDFTTDDQIDST